VRIFSPGRTVRGGRMSASSPHSAAFVAGHDAPLIGDAPRRACASTMEGGDEHADVGGRRPFGLQPREPYRAAAPRPDGVHVTDRSDNPPFAAGFCAPPPSPSTMRRSSANAPQHAGASQRDVAMSTPG
jgi:hypothetical protein